MSNESNNERAEFRVKVDAPNASDQLIDAVIAASREFEESYDLFSQMRAARKIIAAVAAAQAS